MCPVCRQEIAEESLERILPILKRPETPDVRMMSIRERLFGVVRNPSTTYSDIAHRPDTAGPLVIIIINALIMMAFYLALCSKMTVRVDVNGTLTTFSLLESPYAGPVYVSSMISVIPNIFLGMIYLFVGSLFAHLAFKVTGGTGSRGKTVSIVGYSMMPVIVVRLISVLVVLAVLPVYNVDTSNWIVVVTSIYGSAAWGIIDIMTTISFVWVGFVLLFGIREAHNTSTMWAFLVSAACMAVLIWTFWQAH